MFSKRRELFNLRLLEDIKLGRVDEDIIDILLMFNNIEEYYTTSSCSGRITIHKGKVYEDKRKHVVLFKMHELSKENELSDCLIEVLREHRFVWLKVSGFIIHVITNCLENAIALAKLVRRCGMKKDICIRPIRNNEWLIVLKSPHNLSTPLSIDVIDSQYVNTLVKEAVKLLRMVKIEIKLFKLCLTELISAMKRLSYYD